MMAKAKDDEGAGSAMQRTAEEGQQGEAFEGGPGHAPPGWVQPPIGDAFDNATHLFAGPEVQRLVTELLSFDEFRDLQSFPYEVVWRKKTRPMIGGAPVFATVTVFDPLVRFLTEGKLGYAINLHWQHLDDLRTESSWVHPVTLQQHIHHALMHLLVTEEVTLARQQPPVQLYPETVKRYGAFTPAILRLKEQLALWPDPD